MKSRLKWLLPFLLLFLITACTHVISKNIRENSDLSLTLKQVRENPDAYKGKSVVWGGEIIQVINQPDGTTEIEVFQESLNFQGEPKERATSEGRFLVLDDKFLDPYIYWEGRRITVAGELQGEKTEPIGKMYYRYPLVTSKQIYLWPDYDSYAYYSYDPWWYYDPWWEYPYGFWGFGFYSGYHHHHHPHHHPGARMGGSFSPHSRSGKQGFLNNLFGSGRGLPGTGIGGSPGAGIGRSSGGGGGGGGHR